MKWTQKETDQLLAMTAAGMDDWQIGDALGRSASSVGNKRRSLGLTASKLADDPADEDALEDLESQLEFTQKLLDESKEALRESQKTLDEIMDKFLEQIAEEQKARETLHKKMSVSIENSRRIEEYLSHGPLWRLFHRFRRGGK